MIFLHIKDSSGFLDLNQFNNDSSNPMSPLSTCSIVSSPVKDSKSRAANS